MAIDDRHKWWIIAGMTSTSTIADALGRKVIAKAVGVGDTAVSNAVVRGKFPPSWFIAISNMAAAKGIECPPDLFGMKTADAA